MEKDKTFFMIVLLFLGAVNLFAQRSAGTDGTEPNPNAAKVEMGASEFLLAEIFHVEISSVQNDIENLKESFQETNKETYKMLFERTSKLQTFQIISAVSEALIALLFLGAVVLFLLKNKFHTIQDAPGEESKSTVPEALVTELNTLKGELEDVKSQLRHFSDRIDSQSKEEASRLNDKFSSFQKKMMNSNKKIREMETAISLLKTIMHKHEKKHARKEEVEKDPVAVFNRWAQNPYLPLPQYFTYITKIKTEFRTKQEFTDTDIETDWIMNTIGERKYLFPNPKKIDNLSGSVDKFYKVIGLRKDLGSNLVKITDACQIREGNFIEYQGELELMQ